MLADSQEVLLEKVLLLQKTFADRGLGLVVKEVVFLSSERRPRLNLGSEEQAVDKVEEFRHFGINL